MESALDRIVALRSAVRTMRGVFGGAEAIPVVEMTTRSLRNVPEGKELVHYLPKKEARIRKIIVSATVKLWCWCFLRVHTLSVFFGDFA